MSIQSTQPAPNSVKNNRFLQAESTTIQVLRPSAKLHQLHNSFCFCQRDPMVEIHESLFHYRDQELEANKDHCNKVLDNYINRMGTQSLRCKLAYHLTNTASTLVRSPSSSVSHFYMALNGYFNSCVLCGMRS
jgi:hypothetical protein